MKQIIGKEPSFYIQYVDKNITLYKIIDENCKIQRQPRIIFNGNVSSDYNEKNYGKAKKSSIAILSDRFFGNSYDYYNPDEQEAYVMSINGKPVHANTSVDYATSLLTALKDNNLHEAELIGKSYGGIIALQALNHDTEKRIDHVYGCNMPLYGSPLADYDKLKKFVKNSKNHSIDHLLAQMSLKIGIDNTFGSTKENAFGVKLDSLSLPKNLNKFTVISSLAFQKDACGRYSYTSAGGVSKLVEKLSTRYIWNNHRKRSDGIVIVDPSRMDREGIDHHIIENSYHSDMSNEKHLKKVYEYIKK